MRMLCIMAAVLALTACTDTTVYPQYETDQQLRREIFKECMAALPKGPVRTVYNDWDEVVEKCDDVAYYQAQSCVSGCPVFPQKKVTP